MTNSHDSQHVFVGFGFGPIQAGLFVSEAFKSGNFKRIVIAEVDQQLIDAIRASKGSYCVNIAHNDGIEVAEIEGVEIFNPSDNTDRQYLSEALAQATEIVTSLPSVSFYDAGQNSVSSLIAQGLTNGNASATIIYTAENNNHAAEILNESVNSKLSIKPSLSVQYLNTVIGKMSQVVTDKDEITKKGLSPIAAGIDRAFLVEAFNKIMVTKCSIAGFTPSIDVFIEKDDLLPFEESKLFGHNAIHALLGYLGAAKGYTHMSELSRDMSIMAIAKAAFINESGAALIKKYATLNDNLFTESGYREYADDLLERMTNPYLADTVERTCRDPKRKLSMKDRIFGTMALALEYGIEPDNMAAGAAAGVFYILQKADELNLPHDLRAQAKPSLHDANIENILNWLWNNETTQLSSKIIRHVKTAVREMA